MDVHGRLRLLDVSERRPQAQDSRAGHVDDRVPLRQCLHSLVVGIVRRLLRLGWVERNTLRIRREMNEDRIDYELIIVFEALGGVPIV